MAYEGPEYWYVIYKAVGDFGDLMRDAAAAKAAMQGMADSVKAETAAEVAGATQAAQARQKDISAIQQETQALGQLTNAAKNSNTQLLYGGRSTAEQHLSDLAQELNYTTLLNRQKWLGFSSVQQAMSYRQQMYNLALLENRAHFAGYQTADQYLGFLQRETAVTSALTSAIRDRSSAIGAETQLLLAHANAMQGTHQTAGSLGEQLAGAGAAFAAIPNLVTTRLEVDAGGAMAVLSAYRAMLMGLPTSERLSITAAATRLGGIPLTPERETVPVMVRPDIDSSAVNRMLAAAVSRASVTQPAVITGSGAPAAGPSYSQVRGGYGRADFSGLGESLSEVSQGSAVSADAIHRFGDSAQLAAVDVRALEEGIGRLAAAQQLLGEVNAQVSGVQVGRSSRRRQLTSAEAGQNRADYFGLNDIIGQLREGALSDAAGGYPRPAPMQIVSARQEPEESDLWEDLRKYMPSAQGAGGGGGEPLAAVSRSMSELTDGTRDWRNELEGANEVWDEIAQTSAKVAEHPDNMQPLAGMGGAAGGGGGGPPSLVRAAVPDPDDEDSWHDLEDAERGAASQAVEAARHFLSLTETSEGTTEAAKYMSAAVRAQTLALAASGKNAQVAGEDWHGLSEAEREISDRALDAVARYQDMATSAGTAGAAAKVMSIATAAQTLATKAQTAAGLQEALATRGETDAEEELSDVLEGRVIPSLDQVVRTTREVLEARRAAAGAGGGGAGGGGGTPPGAGSPDDDEPDPDIWRLLAAAIGAADDRLRDYSQDSAGARRELPNPDDWNAWNELGDAERTAGQRAADAVRQLQEMAQAAAAAGKAADAAKYAWAANTLLAASMKSAGSDAEEEVSRLAELSAGADKVRDSTKYAYAAQQLLASGLNGVEDPAAKAAMRLTDDANAAANATRSFSRWTALLKTEVPLWSGLLGDTHMIGMVQLWHIALDSVVEVLALWVPALVTAGAGLAGWAAAATKSAQEVARQYVNLRTVGSALNETIAPLTDNFQKMENAVRPQVYELLGDYLSIAGGKAGPFNQLVMQTGNYLDRLAAKITVAMTSGGSGLANFFQAGTKDLALIGQGFDSLGVIVEKFLKATAITHVAEDLAAVGDAILKVAADIVKIIPTPVLAVALGLHAIVLWGGLAADVVGKVVIKVAALASNFDSLNGLSMSLARNLSASDEQLVKIGSRSAAVQAVFDALGGTASKEEIAQTSLAIEKEAGSVENFVGSFSGSAARLEQFGGGLDNAGKKAVALGISAGATDSQLAGMATRLGGAGEEAEGLAGGAGDAAEALGGGGLLASLGNIIPVLGNVYVDVGLLAAALVGLFVYLGTRADSTKKFTDALGQVVAKSSDLSVVSTTVTSLAKATQALNEAQKTGVGNTAELSASQADLSGKLGNELTHVGDVSKAYGTDFVGSLNLLKAAGVSVSQLFSGQNGVWSTAMQMVKGLVAGYQAMGQQLGMVGGDLNAMQLSESSQLKSMQTLNQAWDAFTKLVAGAPTAFISYAQGVAAFQKDAAAAGASMTGLSANSLTLQNDFQSNYSNVEQLFDAFRNDQAAGAGGNFAQFVKNAVQTLIPMAGGSKEAAAQISALAQEAGGPATTNIADLAKWAGKTHDPLAQLYADSNKAAIGASNLSQDAGKLTSTLQQLLDPAMANAIFNAHGGQQTFEEFSKSLLKSGPNAKVTIDAAHNVAQELLAVTGNSKEAKAQFIGYAEASGLNAKQAEKLWDEASQNIGKNVGKIRDDLAAQSQVTMKIKPPTEGQDIMSSFKNGTFYEATFLAWIPGVQKALTIMNHYIGAFFTSDIPHWFDIGRHAFASGWDGMIDWFTQSVPHAFETAWGGMVNWFTQSVPHGFEDAWGPVARFFDKSFTHDIPAAWDKAWSKTVSPVEHALDNVRNFVASNFDTWWKTHGSAVEAVWSALWGQIRGDALAAWHFIEDDARDAYGAFVDFWHGIVRAAEVAWSGITAGAKAAWTFIVSIFDSGPVKDTLHVLGELFTGLWATAVNTAKDSWSEMAGILKAGWAVVTGLGKIAWDAIWNFAGADIKSIGDVLVTMGKVAWDTVVALAKVAWDTCVLIVDEFLDIITGHWQTAWKDLESYGIQVFNAIKTAMVQIWNAFSTAATQVWNQMWNAFSRTVSQAWNVMKTTGVAVWHALYTAFDTDIIQNLNRFFTSTVPGWFSSLKTHWDSLWSTGWTDFNRDILSPIEKFFTTTLPNAMLSGLKDGINHVIDQINKVISMINAVTSIVGVKISPIGHVASGGPLHAVSSGSVPGTGDEDGTHIVAMGGEYMLRKPARMALQATYGPDFLDALNNADTILGSGSRGNAASQRRSGGGRYASGGVLGDLGNWLGDAGSAISGAAKDAWGGITSAAKDVASFGEKAVFDALWTTAGVPTEKALEGLGTPGDLGAAWLQDVHNGVEGWIDKQTAKATASAPKGGGITGSGVSNSSAEAALQSAAAKMGWTGAEWTALFDVEEREAGFSLTATNPSSGAYGMAQFIDGAGEYAQYGGNSSTAAGQAVAMVNYIAQRYRTPEAAWAHEEADGWYATGGAVVNAIKAMGASANTKKSLALGSYLLTHWNEAATDPSRDEFGPWLVNLKTTKMSKANAENATKALSEVAASYGTGAMESTTGDWSTNPAAAALKAYGYASEKLGTHWSTPSSATLADAWDQVTSAFGAAKPTTTSGTSTADASEYVKQAALLYPEWEGALGPWHSLDAIKAPAATTAKASTKAQVAAKAKALANWQLWLKQRAVIEDRVKTASGYVAPLFDNLKTNPVELTAAEWSNTDSSVRRFEQAVAASTWALQNESKYTGPIQSNLTKMLATIPEAYSDWHEVYGTTHTPGPGGGSSSGVSTPGTGSGPGGVTGPTVISLSDLIIGSPSPGTGGGNMGFNLAGGGEVGLSDVAGMFSGGMAAGGVLPTLNVPGLSANMAKQLSSATSGSMPRTLSEAAGSRVGLQVDQLTINNPVAEKPSDTIARSSNRLAALGGRGSL